MGRIRVALEERLRSPELSVDEAVNSRGPHGPGWEFPVWCWWFTKGVYPQKMQNQIQVILGLIWMIQICRLMVGVLIGLIGVTTWLTYPPVIKNWCLSALLPIASFKCMIWMIYMNWSRFSFCLFIAIRIHSCRGLLPKHHICGEIYWRLLFTLYPKRYQMEHKGNHWGIFPSKISQGKVDPSMVILTSWVTTHHLPDSQSEAL